MPSIRQLLLLSCGLLLSQPAVASSPAVQVRDIKTGISNRGFVLPSIHEISGVTIFASSDPTHGLEVWRSDGTVSGTRLIRDICPGSCSSVASELQLWQGRVYFLVNDGRHMGLWRTDGTVGGTELLGTLFLRSAGLESRPWTLRPDDNLLISLPSSLLITLGASRWRYVEGEGLSELIPPEDPLSSATKVITLGGVAFYGDGGHLWRTEGTAESTRVVQGDLSPSFLTPLGDRFYFTARRGLWSSDGTGAGTSQVAPALAPRDPEHLAAVGDRLFFIASGANGRGLWRSDGTAAGTEWITAVEEVREVAASGGLFYFNHDTQAFGEELWVSDGTAGGTRLVLDIRAGDHSSSPRKFLPFAHGLVFSANRRMWVSDGSAAGTRALPTGEENPGGANPVGTVGDVVYFETTAGSRDSTLWLTDGTAEGTRKLRDLEQPGSSSPSELTVLGSSVVFSADDGPSGREPWRSDGTSAGTHRLQDVHLGSGHSRPRDFSLVDGKLLFAADLATPNVHSLELWSTDGSEVGTTRLRVFHDLPTTPFGRLESFLVAGDLLYFSGSDEDGAELWRSDGTTAGTFQVRDIFPGTVFHDEDFPALPRSSFPRLLGTAGDTVFFTAYDGERRDLWFSNGSETDRLPLDGLAQTSESRLPGEMKRMGGRYFFNRGPQIWSTDGTAEGTGPVADVPSADFPHELTVSGDQLFFFTGGFRRGSPRLWRLDGAAQVSLVSTLELDGPAADAANLQVVGDRLFFEVQHESTGVELWTSDGTPEGTRLLRDIAPGAESSYPTSFEAVDDLLLFSAATAATGREMWVSDGTVEGTRPLPEIAPGPVSSDPSDFVQAGPSIFFAATHPESGRELWTLERQSVLDLLDETNTPPALLLEGQRFEVTAEWDTGVEQGFGQPVELTDDSGYFWFFGEDNVELVVKVLDACESFDHFWVFAAGLTDVEVTLTVLDRLTGEQRQYVNPRRRAFEAIQDTAAFATCSP